MLPSKLRFFFCCKEALQLAHYKIYILNCVHPLFWTRLEPIFQMVDPIGDDGRYFGVIYNKKQDLLSHPFCLFTFFIIYHKLKTPPGWMLVFQAPHPITRKFLATLPQKPGSLQDMTRIS